MIPDINALWVVFFLLLSTFLLNTLVFRPILAMIDQRAGAVRGARESSESASKKAADAAAEYARTLNAAHAEIYKQMDETRRAALERRTALLAETRGTVEQELATAAARVKRESAEARANLDRQATELAAAIATRVLGRAS
jgi:F-type H+-transporting ATPase subunit b